MLSIWYLASHLPGRKKEEGAVGCLNILGFLGSAFQRIRVVIIAALYPIHFAWAKFLEICVRTCQMHNFERILAHMISTLMGSQGLAYDMHYLTNALI